MVIHIQLFSKKLYKIIHIPLENLMRIGGDSTLSVIDALTPYFIAK